MRLLSFSFRATTRGGVVVFSCSALLFTAVVGWSQPPAPKAVPKEPPQPDPDRSKLAVTPVPVPPVPKSPKDPTQPDPDLRSKLDPPRVQPDPGRPQDAPVITLKARLITPSSATALLDIDGRLYSVRKGAVLGLGGRNAVRVIDVSTAGVQIEFVASKEVVLLP